MGSHVMGAFAEATRDNGLGHLGVNMLPGAFGMSEPLSKAVTSGDAYRTRYDPVLSHSMEVGGVKDRAQQMLRHNAAMASIANQGVPRSYINTRLGQFDNWFTPKSYYGDTGCDVKLSDPNMTMTTGRRERRREILKTLNGGGTDREHPDTGIEAKWDSTYTRQGDGFWALSRKGWYDLLRYAHCAFEIEREDGSGRVGFLKAIDASMIRMTRQPEKGAENVFVNSYEPTIRSKLKAADYVMVDTTGKPVREYQSTELAFFIRNPVTDEFCDGYGVSDLEFVTEYVASIGLGIRYNRDAFANNHIPPGFLEMYGYGEDVQRDIVKQIREQVGRPGGAFRLLTLLGQAPDSRANWISLDDGASRREFMWERYIQFLICIFCGITLIAPEEMNLQSFMAQTQSLNAPSPAARITHSTDKGLVNHLSWYANEFTEKIVWEIEPSREFSLVFDNLRERDTDKELNQAKVRLDMGLTVPAMECALQDIEVPKIPVDPMKYTDALEAVMDLADQAEFQDEIDEAIDDIYRQLGGRYSITPYLPVGVAQQQFVAQEIGQAYFSDLHPGEQPQGFGGQPGQEDAAHQQWLQGQQDGPADGFGDYMDRQHGDGQPKPEDDAQGQQQAADGETQPEQPPKRNLLQKAIAFASRPFRRRRWEIREVVEVDDGEAG